MKFNEDLLLKPLVRWRAAGIKILFLIGGLIMIGLGVYFNFFRGKDYVKASAVVVSVREDQHIDTENHVQTDYWPTVRYTVDGKEYTQELDSTVGKDQVGKEIKIKYDPRDPGKVLSDTPAFTLYLLIGGAVVTVGAAFALLKTRSQVKQLREEQPVRSVFGASRRGPVERRLYFVTDTGTIKGGCHIEDENRRILYEAVCTKFSALSETEYRFVDHVLGSAAVHLAGKTATTSSNGLFVIDNHSTFAFDGVDIWKLLHNNGISIRTGMNGLRFTYGIDRDGAEIAFAENVGKYVHEEDEEAHGVLAKTPAPGFFRIRTNEENLDAVFLTLFAIGRTDMMLYR